ncbi:DUF2946 family protein [Aliiroseovarius sp. 2305UL8-7]|uniref:DUF2946 family protein n=1 Tax=Aliiroseovarius conchicola TaxID=3121637 RepID=UPI0035292FCD
MRQVGQIANVVDGWLRPVRHARRLFAPMVAMTALVLQLFTSSMGQAADGTWIEICSDFGTSYVQVDLGDGAPAQQKNCPDCENCALCATGSMALVGTAHQQHWQPMHHAGAEALQAQLNGPTYHRAWPETRGPPAAYLENVNCAICAETATIPVKGGAL